MKCKVITSSKYELEDKINKWLESEKIEISHVVQTDDTVYVTVTIFYLDQNEIRSKKLKNLNNLD